MKDLHVPTTATRRRLHAAAATAGWTEGEDGPGGDEFVKGELRINVGYGRDGRILSAFLMRPPTSPHDDGVLAETRRFAQVVLWIGSH